MTITLYKNNSEINRIGKNLTTIQTITGTLNEECSVIKPSVLLEISGPTSANYLYIKEFGRYYFIKDKVFVDGNLWRFVCEVDVLESFKSEIRANECVLARQEKQCNLYLHDDKMLYTTDTFTTYNVFPNKHFGGNISWVVQTTG